MSVAGAEESRTSEPFDLPIDGVLDLHPFSPRQVKDLVTDYLAECQQRGILVVRIIHGKGIGALQRTVHALLARHSEVIEYWLDHTLFSGAGATVVRLRPPPPPTAKPGPPSSASDFDNRTRC
jgi:DNA-nicking Smr family endonuclease